VKGRGKLKNKKMRKISFILALGLALAPVIYIFAQGPDPILTHPEQVIQLLNRILNYAWTIMGIIVVMMLLYAGFTFVTAAGSDEKVETAKKMIKWSLVGIVVMILSGGVMLLIENFLRGA